MARLSYDTPQSTGGYNNNNNNNQNQVGFFQLKNDGDTAIVRIMHDSVEDFDLLSVHTLKMGSKFRKISCVRNTPYEPIENCPLCEIGESVSQRFYIHMLQYDVNDQGAITVKPVIWDRAKSQFAPKIKSLIEEYGPLSQRLFKVKRTGRAGATNTTYELIPCDKDIYNDSKYPNKPNTFNNYDVLGTMVLDKTAPEIITYIQTGNFPMVNTSTTPQQNIANDGAVNNNNYAPQGNAPMRTNYEPNNNPAGESTGRPQWNTPPTTGNGPDRTYGAPTGTGVAPNRPNRYY